MKLRAVSVVLLGAMLFQSYCAGFGCLICLFAPSPSQNHKSSTTSEGPMAGMSHDHHNAGVIAASDAALASISVDTAMCSTSSTCSEMQSSSRVEPLAIGPSANFVAIPTISPFNDTDLLRTVALSDINQPALNPSSKSGSSILRI